MFLEYNFLAIFYFRLIEKINGFVTFSVVKPAPPRGGIFVAP